MFNTGSWPNVMKSMVELANSNPDSNADPAKVSVWVRALRIENSRHSVICTFGLTSWTMSCTLTYYMSKNRAHFFLSDDLNDIFVRFDFIQILV